MASAVYANPTTEPSAPADDLDNLLNYDAAVDDFLKDLPLNNEPDSNNTTLEPTKNIDEEITIKRKRKPVPKLDENLLTSAQGLPRLRRISKDRLKLHGKGHEFGDIGRLMNMYQLWMDDMYPRAKFGDATNMIEKVGHTRRLQVLRRTWLDMTKPGKTAEEIERENDAVPERAQGLVALDEDITMSGGLGSDVEVGPQTTETTTDAAGGRLSDVPDMDDLDELLAGENIRAQPIPPAKAAQRRSGPFEEEEEQMDGLDLLIDGDPHEAGRSERTLREQSSLGGTSNNYTGEDSLLGNRDSSTNNSQREATAAPPDTDDFADEEAVLAEMGGSW